MGLCPSVVVGCSSNFGQASQHSAEAAAEESERIFSKLIRSVEKRSEQAKELIRLQEEVAVGQAEKLLEKLQREMAELRRADGALKSLSGSEDHVKFLQVGSNSCWSAAPVRRGQDRPEASGIPPRAHKVEPTTPKDPQTCPFHQPERF